jgi:hypothetical protein
MPSDLPELPDEVAAELDALTPEGVTLAPACNPDDLTPEHLALIRQWLWLLSNSDQSLLVASALPDDVLDQSLTAIVSDHRAIGIDLTDRRDLMVTYHGLQLTLVSLQRDWEACGDVHTYIHIARPISNLALAYELLLLDVCGEDAAFFPEEV